MSCRKKLLLHTHTHTHTHKQVLQLDICAFTELSQKMTPMELAQALHDLFSSFDSTVQNLVYLHIFFAYTYIHTYIYLLYIQTYVHTHVCIYVCMYVCMCI
jgi:hypothetical protein